MRRQDDGDAADVPVVLPPLPLESWRDTRDTLQLFCQIIGKIRLALMPPQNHWWHVPLYVTARGLTSRPLPFHAGAFQIDLDFLEHAAIVTATTGERMSFPLPGSSVAHFHDRLFHALGRIGVEPSIRLVPYEVESKLPFPEDAEHASYDGDAVRRFWRILVWSHFVLSEFAGRFYGKTTPVHLFWHSFDLALTRFSGRPAPTMEGANRVNREAYSHEVISFGFWTGDATVPEPAYYSYTSPEPAGMRDAPLEPDAATWIDRGGSSLAVLPYERVRTSEDPRTSLLDFLESAYQAGARLGGWDIAALTRQAR